MFPMYSKNSDHIGPLSGNSSPLPLISLKEFGKAGIIKQVSKNVIIEIVIGIGVPFHCSEPPKRKQTNPMNAPIISIG